MNITLLLGAIALFIYSLDSISKNLVTLSINKIKNKLGTITSSLSSSFLTGFISTTILQSSSALIMLTIALINAKLLSFNQSIGIVLGSNIATTLSSFLIGLNIEKIAPFFLLLSLPFLNFKNDKIRKPFTIIFFIFLLFYSFFLISISVSPLKDSPIILEYIKKTTDNFFLSLIIGVLLTATLQSSSLFIAILQILAMSNIITTIQAIPLIFGANIGTSFDALITLFSSNKESKKLAHFSIFFNILTTTFFIIFLNPFTSLLTIITNKLNTNPTMNIAIINILFNILGVLITLPFINKIKRYYSKW